MLRLAPILRHGVVSRQDALAAGVSPRQWAHLHERGHLEAVHPGVSKPQGTALDRVGRIAAAVAWGGSDSRASHRSAAHLWGVTRPDDDPIDILLPLAVRRDPPPGIAVHRSRMDADLAPSTRSGIACTNPLRTIVDLGAVAADGVEAAFEELVVTGLVSPVAVTAALERNSHRGRDGCGALRRALQEWPLGEHTPDSRLEIDLARRLVAAGIGGFEFHRVEEGFEVDFAYVAPRVVIETDGFEHHGTRDAFERDRYRDLCLAAAGWHVVRVTWLALHERPDETLELIARTLGA